MLDCVAKSCVCGGIFSLRILHTESHGIAIGPSKMQRTRNPKHEQPGDAKKRIGLGNAKEGTEVGLDPGNPKKTDLETMDNMEHQS